MRTANLTPRMLINLLKKAGFESVFKVSTSPLGDSIPKTPTGPSGRLDLAWLEASSAESDAAVLRATPGGTVAWARFVNERTMLLKKGASDDLTTPRWAGTTFPTSPLNGQFFHHDTHRCWFNYSSAASGWLSTEVYDFDFGVTADTSATNFLKFGEVAGNMTLSASVGYPFDIPVKVVGVLLCMSGSQTCTVTVGNGATAVTGAALALSAQQSKSDMGMLSNTIAAGSILTVAVTSGTIDGPAHGKFFCRRFET